MDEIEDNTTVLSTLRSFNKFLSQPFDGTPPSANTSDSSGASLQMQFQQRFLLEDQAAQIRSKSHLIQVERERIQMELSHKRARIELERDANTSARNYELEDQAAQIRSKSHLIQVERERIQMELSHKRARIELERDANTNARNYEREADKYQELLTRIKALEEKEMDFQSKLQEECEMNKSYKKTIESQSKKLLEKENKLAEANEAMSVLKGKVSELQLKIMNLEMQLKSQETEKQELTEQLEIQRKKLQDGSQTTQALQELQVLNADYELKIKTLEQKLSSQEQDAAIVKSMKSDLEKLPKIERELQQLREENSYHREMRENNALLKEEVESLRRAAERYERMKEELVALELDKEKILKKLKNWENMEQTTGLGIKTPDDFSRQILALQQREMKLKEENIGITNSARILESSRQKLQDELRKMQSSYLEEKKKREQHDALVRRLQKRVLLLSKERDGMRAILDSYDSELTPSEHTPQLSRRLREAEENLLRVHTHNAEMEVHLSQALEETGLQKQRAELLTAELSLFKSQMGVTDQSTSINSEAVNSLRLKIEELEAERGRLEEENRILEMRLERLSLQGSYDPSKAKVIHFSMNPASKAQQQRKDEAQNLRDECNKLRELVRILEGGTAVPDKLEAAGSIQTPILEVSELKKQVESAELKNQRLREVFQTKIHEFRTVCYMLTGYRIDITTENQYRLTSMYAEHKDDNLLFKVSSLVHGRDVTSTVDVARTIPFPGAYADEVDSGVCECSTERNCSGPVHSRSDVPSIAQAGTLVKDVTATEARFSEEELPVTRFRQVDPCDFGTSTSPSGGKLQLLETSFSRTLKDFIDLHLHHQNSIPAFLSAVTLDLFSRQTFA